MSMKNFNDIFWNRTSDLAICSTAPYPLCYRGLEPTSNTSSWKAFSENFHHVRSSCFPIINAVPATSSTARSCIFFSKHDFLIRVFSNVKLFAFDSGLTVSLAPKSRQNLTICASRILEIFVPQANRIFIHIIFIDYRTTFLGSTEMTSLNCKKVKVYELNEEL